MTHFPTVETIKGFDVTRINNDINGNGRYVMHFLAFGDTYSEALANSRAFGGKVYRAKWYGGGIVFQAVNLVQEISPYVKGE